MVALASPHALLLLVLSLPALVTWRASSWLDWWRGAVSVSDLGVEVEWPVAPRGELRSTGGNDQWAPILQLLQGWGFTKNYAIVVGTAEGGRVFQYEGGNFKLTTRIPTGSTSKWPSAMMFAGLVNDGTIKSLDDPVSDYLSWWTRDPSDLRSTVTFRMLLSFTSGFGDGQPGQEANSRAAREWRHDWNVTRVSPHDSLESRLAATIGAKAANKCNMMLGNINECARSIYEGVKLIGIPGQSYSYNSNHLQIAAAVAMTASGLSIQEIQRKYLKVPYNMTASFYLGLCPDFGAGLFTTGEDYANFLAGVLGYKALSKDLVNASEQDYTPFLSHFYTLYGNYGFGHFLFCFDSVAGMTKECRQDQVHSSPGAFGFIPMISRKLDYYMALVSAEVPPYGEYGLSGIPEYLAVALKPHVDAIIGGHPPQPAEQLTHSPRFLSLSISDVNYCVYCKLNPENCSK